MEQDPVVQHTSRRQDDTGMSLIEVVVALTLFMVIAGAVLTMIGGATRLGKDAKYRVEATSLAAREIEITRDAFNSPTRGPTTINTNMVTNPSPFKGGTVGEPLVVNNVPYTIKRNAQWSEMGSTAASTCDSGGTIELAYLRVWVEVSWPALGNRPPVTLETIITPPKGTYSQLSGHVGVKVIDRSGTPMSSVPVTVRSTTRTETANTAADGCALFAFLTPGTYEVTVSRLNHVDRNGSSSATATAQVQPGQLWRTVIDYDEAATLDVRFETDPGYSLPVLNTLPVVLGNSALVPAGSKAFSGTGNGRFVRDLWAYPSGYQVWAGDCVDNDPQYSGGTRGLPVVVNPGQTTTAKARLEPLDVSGQFGLVVQATQVADSSCASGQTVTLGTLPLLGNLRTSLPPGEWTLKAGLSSQTVLVEQGNGPEAVNL
jgi:type II secretory pathway pseudopilin PulG